ncbi:MAG TPA: hypothetical protein VEA69_16975 [Tepidisphaeraceae bacterium]|nr:hypothetical protein [Tepidisphaeraceae bacterium]
MKSKKHWMWAGVAAGLVVGSLVSLRPAVAEDKPEGAPAGVLPDVKSEGAKDAKDLEPVKVELPKPLFTGTPKAPPKDTTVDLKTLGKRRGQFLAPKGVELLSLKKPVKLSDENPIIGDSTVVNDASKEGTDGNWVELAPGLQWVQIDLKQSSEVWAVVLWHYHAEARVYRDVVVQVSDDPDFITSTTIFNNDQDNSAGLGIGKDREYFESDEGKLVDGKGVKGRYVRCYSKGNTSDAQNHYIEVEVWGKAAK